MKKTMLLFTVVLTIMFWSCGGSNEKTATQEKTVKQNISIENIIGEWQCIDITNGVTHMENIAKMQPHFIFNDKGQILRKLKLPDGTFVSQVVSTYKIENGTISSELFESNLYMENDKLIMGNPSEDDKQVYIKINK